MAESPRDDERFSESAHGETCHATCLVLGEEGVLLRGESGAGKSSLCLELLDHYDQRGWHARLVGDDRVRLSLHHGRIVARPHPAIAGMIEIRGLGVRRLAHWSEATVIRLVVDLVRERPRCPQDGAQEVGILGRTQPLLVLEAHQPRAYLIREALAALRQERNTQDEGGYAGVTSWTHSAAVLLTTGRDP